jgi:hypothetical protein
MINRLIRLPSSGAIFNEMSLVGIVRQELNTYGIILKDSPVVLKADGADVDFIVETIGVVEQTEKPAIQE